MIYTIEEITERVRPVAEKYGLRSVYLFGSYARGDATEESDVDHEYENIDFDEVWDTATNDISAPREFCESVLNSGNA